jgi:serine/threonine-protein kinase
MVVLLAVGLILYARSVFIPSSARRTFLASTATVLPACAYVVATATSWRLGVWKVLWLVVAVAVASAASGVIYGLRREVRHARRLGQYTLEEKLGEGGMGVVYRARHALLRRPTAVKLLKGERLGEASLRRFEREVQLTASLSHPNTVSIYDFGHTPEGTFYYAMEYLEGLSLEQLVAHDDAQPPGRVVHILRQVLAALAEAHGVGLVHRDVKPANVILCERGGLSDVAKVVDFGLVKHLDAADSLSHEGLLIGTPHYLAPETIRSQGGDARADLYSVGAVAYFLLTGEPVFEGRTLVEICGHHLHSAPVLPSQRLGRPVPPDLERWVLSCLEKDPARRPRTAEAAAEALDRCATEKWTRAQARSWWIGRGRSLAAVRGEAVQPTLLAVSRPFEYDLKRAR